jgi:hypothetical protein
MLLTWVFTCLPIFGPAEFRLFRSNARERPKLSSLKACLIIAGVSISHFLLFAQNLLYVFYLIHREIASGQVHDFK